MGKIIRVSIKETGGEFTCGKVENLDISNSIKTKLQEDGEIESYCELEDGVDFDAVMYDNLFHFYGPNVRNSKVIIEEAIDEKESDYPNPEDLNFTEIFDGTIDESGIKSFTASCQGEPELGDNELVIYTKKYEKRITASFLIKIENETVFDPKNIYIGMVLLDELYDFVEDEILEHFFYVPKNDFKIYLKNALKNSGREINADNLEKNYDSEESMEEELWMDSEISKTILKNNKIDSFEIEGKGEWENDYLKILDSEEKILHKSGS